MTEHPLNLGLESLNLSQNDTADTPTSTKSSISLLDVLSLYPVCDRLCSHLDTYGLLHLQKITKSLSGNIKAHMKRRWDINRKLQRFVSDPKGLRSQMSRHDAVISGSFAIQFLDHVTWEESDLDMYIRDGPSAVAMGEYLHRKEGYRMEKEVGPEDDEYPENDIMKNVTYKRKRNNIETKIQLIITQFTPAQAILSGFYSTAVVNIITWNTSYSIYPRPTFIHRKAYLLKEKRGLAVGKPIEKYQNRGWQFFHEMSDEDQSIYIDSDQYIGSSNTWKLPLDIADVEVSSVPDFVFEASHFTLRHHPREAPEFSPYYYVSGFEKRSCILRYTYTQPSGRKDRFWKSVYPKMEDLARIEFGKLLPEQIPAPYTDFQNYHWLSRYDANFEKPDTWTYYDHLIPGWTEEWERGRKAHPAAVAASTGGESSVSPT